MKSRALALALAFSVLATGVAQADGCNIANLLFGKVRIELIYNKKFEYETGIIFGNDFDSKRFAYDRILGKIAGSERDGSHRVNDVNGEMCGEITENLRVDTEGVECASCGKMPIRLQKVGNGYAVVTGAGNIMGTIEGRLPK